MSSSCYYMEGGVMVFRPSMEQFRDFPSFISYMEEQGAHRYGVAKIIPPPGWIPCSDYSKVESYTVSTPVSQFVTGQQGVYQMFNIQKKSLSFSQYKEMAHTDRYKPPKASNYEELERKYWKNITFNQPIYGSDIAGTLYDSDVKEWNINHLGTILDTVVEEYGVSIPGVNTAYLYFGMWKTSFAWHTEDMDLYSINYLHFGQPKQWYAIPPDHGERLERLAMTLFPDSFEECSSFMRHKMSIISPSMLKQHSIPFGKVVQEAGNFIITFPYGYHSGFNQGFNCAESTNFASERWIDYGKRAKRCLCNRDMVQINMDVFVEKFQPDQWLEYCLQKEKKVSSRQPKDKLIAGTKHKSALTTTPTTCKKMKVEKEQSDWRDTFTGLWHGQLNDFIIERAFNQIMSRGSSQCCICLLFDSPSPFLSFTSSQLDATVKCLRSQTAYKCKSLKVVVQRACLKVPFSISEEVRSGSVSDDDEGSQLLTCNICNITVHKSCYGILTTPSNNWTCNRCTDKAWNTECSLCALRGGALKRTSSSDQWAHIVCAVTIPEISFGDPVRKEPIVLSLLSRAQQKHKCYYCKVTAHGVCVECVWPKCTTRFHVTCAQYQGYVPQQLGSKSGYVCPKHSTEVSVTIGLGDQVIAKCALSRLQYAHGLVSQINELKSYEVQFDDGTLCSELSLQDIMCTGAPELGSAVKVRWSKRETYSAKIIGYTTVPQYTVKFDDGSSNCITEEYIYSIDEPLPKKIKEKLKKRCVSSTVPPVAGTNGIDEH